jgi:ABC-type oligopeptide transport system ATPase subunit
MSGPLLEVEGLTKEFPIIRGAVLRRRVGVVCAVRDVSFSLGERDTLALVGESGSGKTTVARCLVRLAEPTAGRITLGGRDVRGYGRRDLRELRRRMQLIFQDAYGSLDPRQTVHEAIAEPLRVHGLASGRASERARIAELLALVGLSPRHLDRYPHALSGGERQRAALARSLACEPRLLILDEPLSAVDMSIRAQLLNLLADLQETLGLSYVLIAHDLSIARYLARRVAIMRAGEIVELADRDALFTAPRHPQTRALLEAVPVPDPEREKARRRARMRGRSVTMAGARQ